MRSSLIAALSLSTFIAGGIAAGAFGLGISSAHADDPKPCVGTSFKVAKVEAACKAGGQPAAKKLMNKAKKAATAAGEEFKCKGCHTSLKTFELTGPEAITNLKRYLK